jgi:hypothetical protein
MRARGSNLVAWSIAATVALSAPLAEGQEQAATAEALFREARELSAQGHYAEACPKFAASQKLDPGYGTVYNLGECLSREGKIAIERHGECIHCGGPWFAIQWPDGRCDRGTDHFPASADDDESDAHAVERELCTLASILEQGYGRARAPRPL